MRHTNFVDWAANLPADPPPPKPSKAKQVAVFVAVCFVGGSVGSTAGNLIGRAAVAVMDAGSNPVASAPPAPMLNADVHQFQQRGWLNNGNPSAFKTTVPDGFVCVADFTFPRLVPDAIRTAGLMVNIRGVVVTVEGSAYRHDDVTLHCWKPTT